MNKQAKGDSNMIVIVIALLIGGYFLLNSGALAGIININNNGATDDGRVDNPANFHLGDPNNPQYSNIRSACLASGGKWTPTVYWAVNYDGYSCSCGDLEKVGEQCRQATSQEKLSCTQVPTVKMTCAIGGETEGCHCIDTGGHICNFPYTTTANADLCISDGNGNCYCNMKR